MLLKIHPVNPQRHKIAQAVKALEKGGIIIYPTDTLYGLACSIEHPKAIERICKLRGLDIRKTNLTVSCKSMSELSELIKPLNKQMFKYIKRLVPGPYTFILNSARSLPRSLHNRKLTLGIRIVDNAITEEILEQLGHPILSISFKDPGDELDYPNDPEEIYEKFGKRVDIVVDGGMGGLEPSTVLDCTGEEPEVIRMGKGTDV